MRFTAYVLFTFVVATFSSQIKAQSQDKIGVVLVTNGVVTAKNNGEERKLLRRSDIFRGDVLQVGKDGMAQLRFTDNSLLTLKKNATLSIDEYSHNQQGKNDAFKATLKGGMIRTRTGDISKSNAKNYGVRTPVGVMGVRGTYLAGSVDPMTGEVFGAYYLGSGTLTNESGSLNLGEDSNYDFGRMSANESPSGSLSDAIAFDDVLTLDGDTDEASAQAEFEALSAEEEAFLEEMDNIEFMTDEEFEEFLLDYYEFEMDFDEYFDDDYDSLTDEFFYDDLYDYYP